MQVGGLSEELAVAFNDIDYCMKVRALGKLVVYAPYALLYHYESKSRGLEDTPEKVARFNREVAMFAKKWPDIITKWRSVLQPEPDAAQVQFRPAGSLKKEEHWTSLMTFEPAIRELMTGSARTGNKQRSAERISTWHEAEHVWNIRNGA